jgi:hypothetical protein
MHGELRPLASSAMTGPLASLEWIAGIISAHQPLSPCAIDWLDRRGGPAKALHRPEVIRIAQVQWVTKDQFEFEQYTIFENPNERALLFLARDIESAPLDLVAWQPRTGHLGTWLRRAWGLG